MSRGRCRPDIRRLLKLRHFRMVEVLDSTRSMREAAARLGISTAAVSKSCIEIETIIGARLFERVGGRLEPTHLCHRVLTAARRVDAELIALNTDLQYLDKSLRGKVTIGYQAPALHACLPTWCSIITQAHPYLALRCEYGMRRHLLMGLEANKFDLILADLHGIESWPRLASQVLAVEWCAVSTCDRDMCFSEVLDNWKIYQDRLWMLPVPGMAMRERFDSTLRARGLKPPERIMEINSPIYTRQIQMATDALVLSPLSMLERPHELRFDRSGTASEIVMELGVVWARDKRVTPPVQFVLDTILRNAPRRA
ncbi:LysR family transcriptional regulator [Nguyenibacter vanlangensis]|uniref:LysR family transcriptional regulator n=1 Tax=Nguyenibacter vanlangensis TaxID=1216886 RepID=A0ABZ3DB30_9PROT